jgi:hypothetical protein
MKYIPKLPSSFLHVYRVVYSANVLTAIIILIRYSLSLPGLVGRSPAWPIPTQIKKR